MVTTKSNKKRSSSVPSSSLRKNFWEHWEIIIQKIFNSFSDDTRKKPKLTFTEQRHCESCKGPQIDITIEKNSATVLITLEKINGIFTIENLEGFGERKELASTLRKIFLTSTMFADFRICITSSAI